ncbi:hypothetical protein SAMN04488058_10138 [Deinococcus reticulitermitis]|uniref:Uncharacterized protein n=2 Tax=Deinococcus reticulitermitis TaxID=856736 RepID=A0A1H6RQR3_9DEIO|nr:hypothetical protein SAMN04488058_10138 [Deinococcus reticulitermitis]
MGGMAPLLLRSALIMGLLIAALNTLFAGLSFGFDRLPLWFYAVQLLLLPAMLIPLRIFPQAAQTPEFLRRAGRYALGWAVPFAIYKFSADALDPAFSPPVSLVSYLVTGALFALIFAALRRPGVR